MYTAAIQMNEQAVYLVPMNNQVYEISGNNKIYDNIYVPFDFRKLI